jgi:hypothetical protein
LFLIAAISVDFDSLESVIVRAIKIVARGSGMKALLVMAFLLIQPGTSAAQSGNEMLAPCKHFVGSDANPGTFTGGLCAGAVAGIAFVANSLPSGARSCFPQGLSNLQMVRVLVSFMEANPGRLHDDFRLLTIEAFRQTWPCS